MKYIILWLAVLVSLIIGHVQTYRIYGEHDPWQVAYSISVLVLLGLLYAVLYLYGAHVCA